MEFCHLLPLGQAATLYLLPNLCFLLYKQGHYLEASARSEGQGPSLNILFQLETGI